MALRLITYRQSELIPELPDGDLFHSKRLFRMYESTPGYKPLMVVACDEDGVPVAHLMAVSHRVALFMRRCDVFGFGVYDKGIGCNLNNEDVFAEMLATLTCEAMKDASVIEFRNLDNSSFGYKAFRGNGYFPVKWLRVRNSLHSLKSVEERFSQSRRRQIRKGLRSGAVAEEARSREDIQALYGLMSKIKSSRSTFTHMDFFMNLKDRLMPGENMKIFVVRYKDKVIGGSACVYTGNDALLWFSGSMHKPYAMQYPGILAVWAALKDAYSRGVAHLEFMDVGIPFFRHGYRDFVLRFGGKQSSTRRWFKIRCGWLNKFLTDIYV